MLNKQAGKTTLLWIPDEEADASTMQAAAITNGSPSLQSMHLTAELWQTHRLATAEKKKVYTKTFSHPADCRAVSKRRDAILFTLLLAGHTPLLKAYANQLDTRPSSLNAQIPGGAANRRTYAAALSIRCSTETATLWQTMFTAPGSYHQPEQRASAC